MGESSIFRIGFDFIKAVEYFFESSTSIGDALSSNAIGESSAGVRLINGSTIDKILMRLIWRGATMTQTKVIAFWIAAMLALGGAYGYMTWRSNAALCDCASCRTARDNASGRMSLEPALPLETAMPALKGMWVTPDGATPDLQDKVVLLDFWGTFCAPCISAIPTNNRIYQKYASKGLVLAGVSTDSKIALGEFKKNVEVVYPLLASDAATFAAYKIEFTPSLYLFDRSGKMVWKGMGLEKPDGSPIESFEKAVTQALESSAKKQDVQTAAEVVPPKIGSPFPVLAGDWLTADGKEPEFKGKVVLLDFWGTFCGPCVAAIPANNKFVKRMDGKNFVMAGIAADTKEVLLEFKKTIDFSYPLLAGTQKTFEMIGIEILPSMYLYDRSGKVVWAGAQLEKRDGKPDPEFEAALSAALSEEPAAALPPEFQKLIEQEKVNRAKNPNATEEELGLKIGAAIPDLKGDWMTPTGAAPDLKDKVLLIDFFTTQCGTCVESIPANNALSAKYAPQGLVFAFVSPEPKAVLEEFRANLKTKIEYPVLGNASALFDQCEIKQLPATFLFGRNGKLLWKGGLLEKDGKLEPAFEKILDEALKAH
jgi:thiol-disulfide isomerase/thioredoxin